MRFIFLLLLCFCAKLCFADVYMKVDQFGNVTYSDIPLNDGKKIEIPSTNSSEATLPTTSQTAGRESNSLTANEIAQQFYTEFSIISPKNEDTIQNQVVIPIEIALKPELKAGDKIQLILDGKIMGEAVASTHLQLGLVERGKHQLFAVIIDATQKILQKSDSITIYIHRANLNSSPAAKQNSGQTSLLNLNSQ